MSDNQSVTSETDSTKSGTVKKVSGIKPPSHIAKRIARPCAAHSTPKAGIPLPAPRKSSLLFIVFFFLLYCFLLAFFLYIFEKRKPEYSLCLTG